MEKLSGIITNIKKLQSIGDFQEVNKLLASELSKNKNNIELSLLLLQNHLYANEVELAKNLLENISPYLKDDPRLHWNKARLALKEGKPDLALSIATTAHNEFPEDREAYGILGACSRLSKEYELARKYLDHAIKMDSNHAEAFINRGLLNVIEGKEVEALQDLERAFNLKPFLKDIWTILLQFKMKYADPKDIVVLILDMLFVDRSNQELMKLLLQLIQKINSQTFAVDCFEKLSLLLPDNVDVLFNLSVAYRNNNQFNDAKSILKNIIQRDPDNHYAFFNLGLLHKLSGELSEAITFYQRAMSIKLDHYETLVNLGRALHLDKQYKQALIIYSNAIKLKPDDPFIYNNVGITLSELQQNEKAIIYYEKALQIDPNYAEVYFNLGKIYARKNPDQAIAKFNRALELRPDFADAQAELGRCLVRVGRDNEGRDLIRASDGSISL